MTAGSPHSWYCCYKRFFLEKIAFDILRQEYTIDINRYCWSNISSKEKAIGTIQDKMNALLPLCVIFEINPMK